MRGRLKVKTQIKREPWSSKFGVGRGADDLTSYKTLVTNPQGEVKSHISMQSQIKKKKKKNKKKKKEEEKEERRKEEEEKEGEEEEEEELIRF
jgi:hypothetical protein